MNRLWEELKRRNVVRVGLAYAVVSWLIIEVASTIIPILELPGWATRLILIMLLLGFPLALLFAWAFELTPEGIKKEKDVDRSESITASTGRKLDRAIIAMMAVAITYLVAANYVFDDISPEESDVTIEKSVAVLPFVPLSSGPDDGYFADGLTDEISAALAGLPDLDVAPRASSYFFKGQNLPLTEVADRLEVAHVVDGSVRRDGNRIRATVQLTRASDGSVLWSQNYERTLDDTFAVQQDIAENIATVLDVALDDDARQIMRNAGIGDVEAFVAYQKGLELYSVAHIDAAKTSEMLAEANQYFDRALESASDLAFARIVRADARGHILSEIAQGFRKESYPGEANDVLLALREEYDAAWRLSPAGNQRDILNVERALFSGDWSEVPLLMEAAMAPGDCPLMNWTSEMTAVFGWSNALIGKYKEAIACDPGDVVANWILPFVLIIDGQPEAAIQAVADAQNNGFTHPWLEDARFLALLAAGEYDSPLARGPRPPGSLMLFSRDILRESLAGNTDVARELAMAHWSQPGVDSWSSLTVAAAVGDRQRANEIARKVDASPGGLAALSISLFTCFCGAPFDLEATPNFAARIEEADFPWPPETRIKYPAKTW